MGVEQHKVTKKLPFNYAKRHGVFLSPLSEENLVVIHKPGITSTTLAELQRYLQTSFVLEEIPEEEFSQKLAAAYETGTEAAMEMMLGMEEDMDLGQLMTTMPKAQDLLESEDDAPIIRLINAVLTQAIKQSASDIHFETFENKLSVRYRIDGILRDVLSPPRVLAPLIVSRIKVMAKLDIAEKRLPQDGRITLHIAGRAVDVRVSTLPSNHGERVVLRLLDKQTARLDLTSLGMATKTLKVMQELIHRPHGIILVTGPTGSGKTTTLYAALTELNDASRNILTVEDPIEYDLPGIGQTQVNTKIGMSFAAGLRSILRQDPDVVMIGEIRDLDTVDIAIQASLTGHLVLSTLHTNSAIGAITRLRDMGAESYLLSSTIIGVAAQRLVRLLCNQCKQAKTATDSECQILAVDTNEPPQLYHAVGCEHCNQLGYHGRTGVYELIAIDETLSQMVHDNSAESKMENYAHTLFPSMRQDGFARILNGDTTLEEVLRVTSEN